MPDRHTLINVLRERADAVPSRRAVLFLADGETESAGLDWAGLERAARAVGAALRARGCAGERALLLYPQGVDFVAAFWGCVFAGAVAVPAYPPHNRRGVPRLRAILDDARPRAVLTTRALLPELRAWFGAEGEEWLWIATDDLPAGIEDGWTHPGTSADSLAFLQYTSGSTSAPRGVMVSHANLLHNLRLLQEGWRQDGDAVVVSWLPLFHDMGLIGTVLESAHLGAPCVLMPPAAFLQRPFRWPAAVSRYGATLSGGPNFAYDLAARRTTEEERARLDLSRWSAAFNGAEPVRRDTLERFYRAFAPCGLRRDALFPGYGLAEATLVVSSGRAPGTDLLVASVDAAALEAHRMVERAEGEDGTRPLVGCGAVVGADQRVLIVDPDTLRRCAPGAVGEIWVGGPSVAGGYWNRPAESEATFRARTADTGEGPFLRTGDLGFLHAGELFVTGRAKDLVIIRGRNHYPQDLELTAECADPGVRPGCSAAFALEGEGEERLVVVCEVERARLRGELEPVAAAIRAAVAEEHEVAPHGVVLLRPGAIPKTTSGKIQRRGCRAALLAGELEVVHAWWEAPGAGESEAADDAGLPSRADVLATAPGERAGLVERHLRGRLAAVLRVPAEGVDVEGPAAALGLDSLRAVEARNALERDLGAAPTLADLLSDASVRNLAAALLPRIEAAASAPASAPIDGSAAEQADGPAPLSYAQRPMWLLHQLQPESALFNVFTALRVTPAVDAGAMERALRALAARHPTLRTALPARDGRPVQEVAAEVDLSLPVVDAAEWTEDALRQRLADEAHRPFTLDRAPLLRAALFRRGAEEDVLLLVLHHAVTDFWSGILLLDDLAALYAAETTGVPASLPAPGAPFTDHARRQERVLAGAEGARLWAYWSARLAGARPHLPLPADRRAEARTGAGAVHRFRLEPALTERVKALARAHGTTPFAVLLAGWQALLHRWTGQDDVVVAAPMAARPAAEWEGTVGCFGNPVLLRGDLSGRPTFTGLLARTREAVLGALQHQELPLHVLAERTPGLRGAGHGAPASAMFVFNGAHRPEEAALAGVMAGEPGAAWSRGGLRMEAVPLDERTTPCDLCLWAVEAGGGVSMRIQYAADLFEPETAERLARALCALLDAAAADPARPIGEIPLLDAAEAGRVLAWGTGPRALAEAPAVHAAFEAQAARTPDAPALVHGGETVSYAALDARANRLAHHLLAAGVEADAPVAVCLERSDELIVALLAVLKAGGAYLPLDPAWPAERLEQMLGDSGARLLVTRRGAADALDAPGVRRVRVDAERAEIAARPAERPAVDADGRALAYVIYTSGSTGRPKGVMVPHAALANHTASAAAAYGLNAEDRVLQFASVSFDASAEEIFPALATGAALVLRPERAAAAVTDFLRFCAGTGVTVLDLPTAFWHQVVVELRAGEAVLPPCVRLVILGGERALPERVAEWMESAGDPVRLVNTYGPTEATIVATRHEVGDDPGAAREVPIGRPIDGATAHVLDAALRPVPAGMPGELHLGGAGLARGYWRRPALTAASFVPDPHADVPGARLYATGDLARWTDALSDAPALEYLGRVDEQVKVRGFRVEPGEVEAALRRHPDVRDAVVAAREDAAGGRRLVAYVVARSGAAPAARELRAFLGELLPAYMVPAAFVFLPALPLTPGGKVDRRALPAPDTASPGAAEPSAAPRTPMETLLAGIWAGVLGRERVGVHDGFFELGGDSILALQVVRRTRAAGVALDPWQIFRTPSIAALAAALGELPSAGQTRPPAIPLDPVTVQRLREDEASAQPASP